MKFAFSLTVAFVLALACCEATSLSRRNLIEHDEMDFKKAKILATRTLSNNSTVSFYEPEEGIISVVRDSPPEAKDGITMSSQASKSGRAGSSGIPESPGELYKILTGEDVVPQSLVSAQTRMKKRNTRTGRSLPPPPPPSESDEDEQQQVEKGMDYDQAAENDGGRNLVSCSKWEAKYCIRSRYGASEDCACLSCRSGDASSKFTSKAVYAQANPYRGSVSHMIRYWNGRYWRLSAGADVKEGRLSELWSYGDNTHNWVELFNGKSDGWNWFVDYYDQDQSAGLNIAPNVCHNVY